MSLDQADHKRSQNTIITQFQRAPADLIARFAALRREVIFDCVGPGGIVDAGIAALCNRPWSISGPAITVDLPSLDLLLPAAATSVIQPGDVIVVAARGDMSAAVWGGALSLTAKAADASGIVIDGVVRSTPSLLTYDLPVFCRGRQPHAATFSGPGSINVPVTCGGVLIKPGDIVLGDLDGVCIVSRDKALDLIVQCEEVNAATNARALRIRDKTSTLFEEIGGRERLKRAGVDWDI